MQVTCPQCGSAILADQLNMSHMMANCTSCNTLFNFAEQVSSDVESVGTLKESIAAPRPEKVKREHDGLSLVLRWRWFNYSVLFLIPFALFWNGMVFSFLSFSTLFSFDTGDGLPGPAGMFPLFVLPHTLIGIMLIYYIASLLLNQTRVDISHHEVSVRHGPLPWWGSKTVSTSEINQLYTRETISRGRNSRRATYEVHMIDQKNTHKKLITGLESAEFAFYVEQEIEDHLGIQDRHVRGAYG